MLIVALAMSCQTPPTEVSDMSHRSLWSQSFCFFQELAKASHVGFNVAYGGEDNKEVCMSFMQVRTYQILLISAIRGLVPW